MILSIGNSKKFNSKENILEEWVRLYSTELYNYAVIRLRHRQDAEDIVQTTFLKAFRSFDSFQRGTDERSWLYSILLNSIRDFARKASRTPEQLALDDAENLESYLSDNNTPEQNLLRKEYQERLASGIAALPDHYSQPLILCDIQDLSYKHIAQVLQIPIGTVMSRLARARKSLMELMRED